MNCKDCKHTRLVHHRGDNGPKQLVCDNDKLSEDNKTSIDSDELGYVYGEGGWFYVGGNFGCVHFEPE